MGGRMYSDYFGIAENAFSITPDPRFLYMSERHCEALAHLLYGVVESGCFVLLTGEVGTGKTTVCRAMLEQLPDNIDVALLLNPPQSGRELLLAISDELNIAVIKRDATLHELVYILTRRLLENHANGRRTVVIIDEAQNIGIEVLEQVRLLTNLETSTEKLLHVVLVGQPELREQLAKPSLRQVSQRITARYHLEPLDAGETEHYVYHRLAVAGCRQGLFSRNALRQLHQESKGIPRVINILCDRALLSAFANDIPQVCKQQIRQSAREWRNRVKPSLKWLGWRRLGLPIATLGLLFAAALVSAYSEELQNLLPIPSLRPAQDPAAKVRDIQDARPVQNQVLHVQETAQQQKTQPRDTLVLPIPPAQEQHRTEPLPPVVSDEINLDAVRFIGPGSSPEEVRWLRHKLDHIEGVISLEDGPLFDERLQRRVMALQLRSGLAVDGIAGPRTLACINGMADSTLACPLTLQPKT